jgi:hypothetical protein
MSSETSTKKAKKPAPAAEQAVAEEQVSGFQPWHLFFIGTLLASAASAVAVRGTRPENVVFVCVTVLAAGVAAYAVYRTLWPLVEPGAVETPEMLGGRTRAALEREKTLALRSIKELEFDRAMGKVSEQDFQEMTGRLRTRAVRVIRQLDSGSAAYRELIEKELSARQLAGSRPPAPGVDAAKAVVLMALTAGVLAFGAPASAQMGGTGGMAGMPDARAMSGIPRPDSSVPVGTLSVRLVRGQMTNVITGHPVDFIASGRTQTAKTDENGRALVRDLTPGTLVRASAVVDGERVESQDFEMPDASGVLMLLVASDKSAAEQMAKTAVPGTVSLGGQSRVLVQFEDETLQVYYLFDVVNATANPVKTEPLVFTLPDGAGNATVLEGSAPNAVAKGASFIVSGPFAPGVTNVQLAFSLAPAAQVAIRQPFPIELAQVAVMVEKVSPSMVVSSSQLTTIREGNEGSRTFVLGMGPAVKAGGVLALDVSGLPHQPTWPRNTALSLAVVIIGLGIWGATRTGGRSADAAARQQLESRRERVFAELVKLEQRNKGGKLSDADYATSRGALVAELERIYGELDTGAQGPRGDQGLAA